MKIEIDEEKLNDLVITTHQYIDVLGHGVNLMVGDYNKPLSKSENELFQDLEDMAEGYYKGNNILKSIDDFLSNIPPALRYLILLRDYSIPTDLEILERNHDNRLNIK
jgi:hypothetical protein